MKVIFLDIDGVLNSGVFISGGGEGISNDLVRNLNLIIEHTGVKVVISSDWRRDMSLEEINSVFVESGFCGEIIGATPCLEAVKNLEKERVLEISSWLKENPEIENWIAIDDMDLVKGGIEESRFIRTSFMLGLTEDLAAKAIRILT